MRIGIDARSLAFTPASRAGAYQFNSNLVAALAHDTAHEYVLLCRSGERVLMPDFGPHFSAVEIPEFQDSTFSGQAFEQYSLPRAFHELSLDAYVSLYFTIPLIRSFPALTWFDDLIPWILLQKKHDLIPATHGVGSRMRRYQWWKEQSCRSAEGIIAISESTKQDLIRYWGIPEKRITVVYGTVEPLFHHITDENRLQLFREKYALPKEYLLYVGTIEPRKNVLGLITALAQVRKEKQKDIPLVMVGPRGMRYDELFMPLVRKELGDDPNLHLFTHFVPREDLPLFYNAAKAFCFPSFYEGFGMPVLEALACGTPVITSQVSSLPEVAGDAALYVNPHSTDSIAQAIHEMWSDKTLRFSLRQKGFKRSQWFREQASLHTVSSFVSRIIEETKDRYVHKTFRKKIRPSVDGTWVGKRVLLLRTASWPVVEKAIEVLKEKKCAHIMLGVQKNVPIPFQADEQVGILPVLPEGPFSLWRLGCEGVRELLMVKKDSVVLLYNNMSGIGYRLLRVVALIVGRGSFYCIDNRGVLTRYSMQSFLRDLFSWILVPWCTCIVCLSHILTKRRQQ